MWLWFDAKVNNWESYDPYYNDVKLEGLFDTIVCTNVLSAVSSKIRIEIIENIRDLLKVDVVHILLFREIYQ